MAVTEAMSGGRDPGLQGAVLPTRIAQIVRATSPVRAAFAQAELVPAVESEKDAAQLMERLRWYAGNTETLVTIRVRGSLRTYLVGRGKIGEPGRDARRTRRTLTLVHHVDSVLTVARRAHRARVIDEAAHGKTAIMTEARLAFADLMTSRECRALRQLAKQRTDKLRSWLREFSGSQLFGTGPTIELVRPSCVSYKRNGLHVLRIACNSIVSDPSLMDIVDPHLLTYGDPAFHFGSSEYARVFRADVRAALASRPHLRVVVPLEFFPLIEDELAEFGERVVPCRVGLRRSLDPFDFARRGILLRSGNIATSAMIPLAVVAGSQVEFFGFDGRSKSDKQFWAHSRRAQYDHLYASVVNSHPSFFRDTSFADYYQEHCRRLAAAVVRAESHGLQVLCRTRSHIPCLAARYQPIDVGNGCGEGDDRG